MSRSSCALQPRARAGRRTDPTTGRPMTTVHYRSACPCSPCAATFSDPRPTGSFGDAGRHRRRGTREGSARSAHRCCAGGRSFKAKVPSLRRMSRRRSRIEVAPECSVSSRLDEEKESPHDSDRSEEPLSGPSGHGRRAVTRPRVRSASPRPIPDSGRDPIATVVLRDRC